MTDSCEEKFIFQTNQLEQPIIYGTDSLCKTCLLIEEVNFINSLATIVVVNDHMKHYVIEHQFAGFLCGKKL